MTIEFETLGFPTSFFAHSFSFKRGSKEHWIRKDSKIQEEMRVMGRFVNVKQMDSKI